MAELLRNLPMRSVVETLLAAMAVCAAVLIEASSFIPLREIWSGSLLACVWLWAHRRGWLDRLQQAGELSPSDLLHRAISVRRSRPVSCQRRNAAPGLRAATPAV